VLPGTDGEDGERKGGEQFRVAVEAVGERLVPQDTQHTERHGGNRTEEAVPEEIPGRYVGRAARLRGGLAEEDREIGTPKLEECHHLVYVGCILAVPLIQVRVEVYKY